MEAQAAIQLGPRRGAAFVWRAAVLFLGVIGVMAAVELVAVPRLPHAAGVVAWVGTSGACAVLLARRAYPPAERRGWRYAVLTVAAAVGPLTPAVLFRLTALVASRARFGAARRPRRAAALRWAAGILVYAPVFVTLVPAGAPRAAPTELQRQVGAAYGVSPARVGCRRWDPSRQGRGDLRWCAWWVSATSYVGLLVRVRDGRRVALPPDLVSYRAAWRYDRRGQALGIVRPAS